MNAKFIGLITAASIAITAIGAAPARADEDDVARALAVILGLAVIGSALNDNDDRVVTRTHRHRPHVQPNRRHVEPRPLPRRIKRDGRPQNRLLPGQCLRTFETRRGTYRGFGQRCLRNNYAHAHRLPNRCLVSLKTRGGNHRNVYEARCLRNTGYRLAHR